MGTVLKKIELRNVMLLEIVTILRLTTHTHLVEGDKIREQAKENKKARTGNSLTLSRRTIPQLVTRLTVPKSSFFPARH